MGRALAFRTPAAARQQLGFSFPESRDDSVPLADSASRLETFLRNELGPKVLVTLTQNRSTVLSASQRRGVMYIRLHRLFSEAPEPIWMALAEYLGSKKLGRTRPEVIDRWIEANRKIIAHSSRRLPKLYPVGEYFHLSERFDALNRSFFSGELQAHVTWSRGGTRKRRHSILLGSYCQDLKLIRIHPALDQAFVPLYVVDFVLFHEMLHAVHGIQERVDGRQCVHTAAFRQDERQFPLYDKARKWEAEHIRRLLRYRP
jgi:hypothetical protein